MPLSRGFCACIMVYSVFNVQRKAFLLMFFALAVVFIGSVASVGGVDNTVAFLKGIPGFLDGTQMGCLRRVS